MKDVFVVEALRTPFGSFGGVLSEVPAAQLAATVMQGLLQKSGVPAAAIDACFQLLPRSALVSATTWRRSTLTFGSNVLYGE